MPAALTDDRCDNDVSENSRWYRNQCREHAAQIDADIAEVIALARAKMMGWAAEGWLQLHHTKHVNGAGGLEKVAYTRTPEQEASHVCALITEDMTDALSLLAQECREIAS